MSGGTFGTTADISGAYGMYLGGGSVGSYIGAALSVKSWSSTVVGAIVRGATSQTANLQEWQNSAGTVLAKIDAYGNITAPNLTIDPIVSGLLFGGM